MRTHLLALLVLAGCAHSQTATPARPPPTTAAAQEIPAPGDPLPTVRQKLGDGVIERQISPTEQLLSAMYGGACPDLPSGPGNLSRPACGTGKVLTVRMREGRAVVIEWGDPRAQPASP